MTREEVAREIISQKGTCDGIACSCIDDCPLNDWNCGSGENPDDRNRRLAKLAEMGYKDKPGASEIEKKKGKFYKDSVGTVIVCTKDAETDSDVFSGVVIKSDVYAIGGYLDFWTADQFTECEFPEMTKSLVFTASKQAGKFYCGPGGVMVLCTENTEKDCGVFSGIVIKANGYPVGKVSNGWVSRSFAECEFPKTDKSVVFVEGKVYKHITGDTLVLCTRDNNNGSFNGFALNGKCYRWDKAAYIPAEIGVKNAVNT